MDNGARVPILMKATFGSSYLPGWLFDFPVDGVVMKKGKPFFFRIEASDFFAETLKIKSDKELGKFIRQFAIDLVTGDSSTPYANKVILEAMDYIDKKRVAGSKGGKQKASSAKAVLDQCSSTPLASSSSSSSSSTEESKDKNKIKRFVIPSVEEITAYCLERKNYVDPQKFFDHYEARGWVPKGYSKQMTNWKAAVRTWEGNQTAQPVVATSSRRRTFADDAEDRGREQMRLAVEELRNA
jgi:hypothetical protein